MRFSFFGMVDRKRRSIATLVVSLNFRDEVLSAEYHTIRAAQGTKVPGLSNGYRKEDDRLKAVCIARLVAC
jgi:hypothetical protein